MLFTFSVLFESTNGLFAWSQGLLSTAVGDGAGGDAGDGGSRLRRPRDKSYA
jgi:hypothetical protein